MPLSVRALEAVRAPVGPRFLGPRQKSQSSPRLANRRVSSVLTFKTLPENSSHLPVFMIHPRNVLSLFSLLEKSYFSAQESFPYYFSVSFHLRLRRQWLSIPNPRSVCLYFFLFVFPSLWDITRGQYPQAFANGILAAQLDPIYYRPFIESCDNPSSLPLSSKDTVLRGESRGCK